MGSVRHSPQTRARVIEEFSKCGRVDLACQVAGVDRSCHYYWLKHEPEYKAAYEEANEQVAQLLADIAHDHALNGTEKPVTVAGKAVMMREYDHGLLQFLLMARKPEVYNPKVRTEVSGPGGGAVQSRVEVVFVDAKKPGEPE